MSRNPFADHAGDDGDAGLRSGAFEGAGIGVAERGDFHVRAKGQPGQMILQRDAAAADDGKVDDAR